MGKQILPELLELAKLGDPQAIAALINRHLQPRGIQVTGDRRGDCLQLVLEASAELHPSGLVEFIRRGMQNLDASGIKTVRVYGQKPGEELPLWVEQIELQALAAAGGAAPLPSRQTQSRPSLGSEQLLSQYAAGERNFQGLDLTEADLRGAKLSLAHFQGAVFTWANLEAASFSHSDLRGARLNYANLAGAHLQGANLQGANLQGANLRGANLSWANLQGANLTDADLTGAKLQEACLLRVIMPDGTLLD